MQALRRKVEKESGVVVSVYDGVAADMDTEGGRWQVVCETHGSILSLDTLKQAVDEARFGDPAEFCEDCREMER